MSEVVSVISGKGGVGKTTVAINLTAALQEMNYRCVLIEGNFTSPTASIYLGYLPVDRTINSVLKGQLKLSDVLLRHESGINLITSSLSISDLHDDFSKMGGIIDQLRGMYDVIIFDGAAGLGKETELAVDFSDSVLVVTNPELPAVIDALRAIKFVSGKNKKLLGVVLDRVDPERNQLSVSEVELILETPVISTIPEDSNVLKSVIYNEPLVKYKPKSKASIALYSLAATLVGEEPHVEKESGIGAIIKNIIAAVSGATKSLGSKVPIGKKENKPR